MSDFLKPSTETKRHPISRRAFATGLTVALGGLATGRVDIAAALAQCVGPDVPCLIPDGIERTARAEIFRYVTNGGKNYAVWDAGVNAYVMRPNGTSDFPAYDLQNPHLGSDGLPDAFKNTKNNEWREVEERIMFVSAEPGDPRFNGRLINTKTRETQLIIPRAADAIKDRVIGKLRGAQGCGSECVLNCAEVVVWERLRGASNPVPFKNSKDVYERYMEAVWSWPVTESNPSVEPLASWTEISDERLGDLLAKGLVAPGLSPAIIRSKSPLEAVK